MSWGGGAIKIYAAHLQFAHCVKLCNRLVFMHYENSNMLDKHISFDEYSYL